MVSECEASLGCMVSECEASLGSFIVNRVSAVNLSVIPGARTVVQQGKVSGLMLRIHLGERELTCTSCPLTPYS